MVCIACVCRHLKDSSSTPLISPCESLAQAPQGRIIPTQHIVCIACAGTKHEGMRSTQHIVCIAYTGTPRTHGSSCWATTRRSSWGSAAVKRWSPTSGLSTAVSGLPRPCQSGARKALQPTPRCVLDSPMHVHAGFGCRQVGRSSACTRQLKGRGMRWCGFTATCIGCLVVPDP